MAKFEASTVAWKFKLGDDNPYNPDDIELGTLSTQSLNLFEFTAHSSSTGRDFIVQLRFEILSTAVPSIRIDELNLLETDRSPAATITNVNLVIPTSDLDNFGNIDDFLGGSDLIIGSAFRDIVRGLSGNDDISGRGGNDLLRGDGGNDRVAGDGGNDKILGGGGKDNLIGGAGNDRLSGQSGSDRLIGGVGKDYIDGGGGADRMAGGWGNDTYIVNSRSDRILEGVGRGTDSVRASVDFTLPDNVENLTLRGSRDIDGIGNALNNTIVGNSGDNLLAGARGNDRLFGGSGRDDLRGNGGNDSISGQADDDNISGGSGADFINGGGGRDMMAGGSGNDTYIVDNIGDKVVEAGAGTDLVRSSVSYKLPDAVEKLILTGTAALNGTGNSLANLIEGNNNANKLFGGQGNDALLGKGGADTLSGNGGNDYLDGGSGSDALNGGSGNDSLIWDGNDSLVNGGGGFDSLLVESGDIDLTSFLGTIASIERVDLGNDAGANKLTLSAQDVLDLSSSDTLEVAGDGNDTAKIGTGWMNQGSDGLGNTIYDQAVGVSTARLIVDDDVVVDTSASLQISGGGTFSLSSGAVTTLLTAPFFSFQVDDISTGVNMITDDDLAVVS